MLLQISRDPTPCMAEAALAVVDTEARLYYWLPCDTPCVVILDGNYNTWGVPWQPVVQPPSMFPMARAVSAMQGVGSLEIWRSIRALSVLPS